jgi:hypothetical protein
MARSSLLFIPPVIGPAIIQVFWAVELSSVIRYSDPDGITNEGSWSIPGNGYGIAIDEDTDTAFFSQYTLGVLKRSDFDGSNNNVLYTDGSGQTRGMGFNGVNIFWAVYTSIVATAEKDGSNPTDIITGQSPQPIDCTVDVVNEHVYYVLEGNRIKRCDYDGGNDTTIKIASVHAIALDIDAERIYYVNFSGNMRRVDFDGGGDALVHNSGKQLIGAGFDPEALRLYGCDITTDEIYRVDSDGSNVNATWANTPGNNPFGCDMRYEKGSQYASPNR